MAATTLGISTERAAEVRHILRTAIDLTVDGSEYKHRQVTEWNQAILEYALRKVTALSYDKPYKHIVTCKIIQLNGEGYHSGVISLWNSATDGCLTILASALQNTMPTIELYYWPIAGRMNAAAAILDYASVAWTPMYVCDGKVKSSTPFSRLPVLREHMADGRTLVLSESHAIERYFARRFKLYGTDSQQDALQDAFIAQWEEVLDAVAHIHFGDPAMKEYYAERYQKNLALLLEKHSKRLVASATGLYFGDQITWTDIVAYTRYELLKVYESANGLPDALSCLDKLVATMEQNPQFQNYLKREKARSVFYQSGEDHGEPATAILPVELITDANGEVLAKERLDLVPASLDLSDLGCQ
ncbi:Glutathione S-transferase [Dimargaris verticillata]|uniref:Glutathione S-transferase n=1 Tax=Dimargaris verticillata TaxID=2761393 RepID=A0A9W8B2S3_9FUNG|nr:Glutathione S-transferase [Dimargaris verticillata]